MSRHDGPPVSQLPSPKLMGTQPRPFLSPPARHCSSALVMWAYRDPSPCSFCMQVCKFYVQGRCLAGDRCRYAHPASAASRVELNQLGGRNVSQQVPASCACHDTLTVLPSLVGSWW